MEIIYIFLDPGENRDNKIKILKISTFSPGKSKCFNKIFLQDLACLKICILVFCIR